jgi:hypothetical protein
VAAALLSLRLRELAPEAAVRVGGAPAGSLVCAAQPALSEKASMMSEVGLDGALTGPRCDAITSIVARTPPRRNVAQP